MDSGGFHVGQALPAYPQTGRRAVIALLLLATTLASAQEDSCRALYENRRFHETLDCIEHRLKSGPPAEGDTLKLLELGALSAYLLEDFDGSARYFDRLLRWKPAYIPDPVELPPELVSLGESRIAFRNRTPWRFVPFGAGQWKQGRPKRALLYAGLGVLGLCVNAGTYHVRRANRDSDGTYEDPALALTLYRVQFAGLVLFAGTGVASLFDALFLE